MTHAYYYSDEVSALQVLLEEVTRARPGSPQSRFVKPDLETLARLGSRFHHVLYGRRGTGKSSLLRHIEADHRGQGHLVAWADQETFMSLSYPDVLVSTLETVFLQFATQIREQAPAPSERRWWSRSASALSAHQALAIQLDQAVAQLIDLKAAPSETQIEWTVSSSSRSTSDLAQDLSAGLSKGPAHANYGRKATKGESRSTGDEVLRRYMATKTEHLERAVARYRELMIATSQLAPDAVVILDDFYRLSEADQPRIAGYLHRVVKDTSVWLKIGSIRYWTRLYAGGRQAVGIQVPHDVRELSLDRRLLDFRTSKHFLEAILVALASEAGVDVDLLFSEGARDRLVLASGVVPRDYIGLISDSIAEARNHGITEKPGSERVIAEDVNEAAGRTVDAKFSDLDEDAGGDAVALRELVVEITGHCRQTGSACFLVDFRESELVRQLNRLQNMRFVHSIDTNESLPEQQSSRYNVYLLDMSQLAAQRAWQVDLMGWTKREKRRARKLVLRLGTEAIPPLELRPELPSLDDAAAVIGEVDPPVAAPE